MLVTGTILVSVIVPVWNNPEQLRLCLEALQRQTLDKSLYEIIVVDNGSSDDTIAVARSFSGVLVLEEKRPGSYVARNTAIEHARGKYLAFTDSDCIPDSNWLLTAAKSAEQKQNLGVLSGRIELFHEEEKGSDVYKHYEQLFSFPQDHTRANCATANWLSPRDVFVKLGGFDEAVKSGGDKLMAVRIRDAGYALEHAPTMIVLHPVRATLEALISKRKRLAGGQWQKMRRRPRLLRALAWCFVEAYRRCTRVAQEKTMSRRTRAKVMLVVICMSAVSAAEYLRLYVGGAPAR